MSLKQHALSGVRWTASAVVIRRLVTFTASIVVARLVDVQDVGVIAMAMVFVGVLELFRDLGTGTVIVQRQELAAELLSDIFWFNTAIGFGAATVLFLFADTVAQLYDQTAVGPVLKLLSIGFILSGVSVIHSNLLVRHMRFARLAAAETSATVTGAVCAVVLAYLGFGVWSLAWQSLVTTAMTSVLLWLLDEWRPTLTWDWKRLREVLRYSVNLTAFNLVNYFARNADNALVGRYLGAQALGYYAMAYRTFVAPVEIVSWTVGRVMLPVYSRLQGDNEAFRGAFTRASRAIAFISFPVTLGLLAIADIFVAAILGNKWLPAAPVIAILAPLGALQSVATTGGSIYIAKGRADMQLRWGLISTPMLVASFVIGLRWGIVGVAGVYAAVSAVLFIAGLRIAIGLIDLKLKDYGRALLPTFFCACGMLAVVLLVRRMLSPSLSASLAFALLVSVGALAYLIITLLLNKSGLDDAIAVLRTRAQ